MKIITIGDIRGRDAWKKVDVDASDKVGLLLGNHDVHYLFYLDFPQNSFMKNSQEVLLDRFDGFSLTSFFVIL